MSSDRVIVSMVWTKIYNNWTSAVKYHVFHFFIPHTIKFVLESSLEYSKDLTFNSKFSLKKELWPQTYQHIRLTNHSMSRLPGTSVLKIHRVRTQGHSWIEYCLGIPWSYQTRNRSSEQIMDHNQQLEVSERKLRLYKLVNYSNKAIVLPQQHLTVKNYFFSNVTIL